MRWREFTKFRLAALNQGSGHYPAPGLRVLELQDAFGVGMSDLRPVCRA